MNIVAVLAHPDDEAFAMSGTIKILTDLGHRVSYIETTDGGAGQLHESQSQLLTMYGSIAGIRKHELEQSAKILGVSQIYYCNHPDGELNNRMIFEDRLDDEIKGYLIKESAQVVIAFDHTGISYHLDHIATSIATCRACYEIPEVVDKVFLFVKSAKDNRTLKTMYPYLAPCETRVTHRVDVTSVLEAKKLSLKAHESQRSDWERFFNTTPDIEWCIEEYYLSQDMGRDNKIFEIFLPKVE